VIKALLCLQAATAVGLTTSSAATSQRRRDVFDRYETLRTGFNELSKGGAMSSDRMIQKAKGARSLPLVRMLHFNNPRPRCKSNAEDMVLTTACSRVR
jgi:hypothetical protein